MTTSVSVRRPEPTALPVLADILRLLDRINRNLDTARAGGAR